MACVLLFVGAGAVSWVDRAAAEISCDGVPATIVGTDGNDNGQDNPPLKGTAGDDVIVGLGGNDLIEGLGGNDRICGSDGLDVIEGGPGNDYIDGGAAGDTASYSSAPGGVDVSLPAGVSHGAAGDDTLVSMEEVIGSNSDDTLVGDEQNNILVGFLGNDFLDGGAGDSDMTSYGFSGLPGFESSVIVNLGQGTAIQPDLGTSDTLAGIEDVTGSVLDDVLIGNQQDNGLFGEEGNDRIYGREGDDPLSGGPGNDLLVGGSGDLDTAIYADSQQGVVANLSTGTASVGGDTDSLTGIEWLNGSEHDDLLTGDAGDNGLIGNGGDDQMDGQGGRDTAIYPGGPVDVNLSNGTAWDSSDPNQVVGDRLTRIENVFGSPQDDVLIGDRGPNLFLGDAGSDTIKGRGGNDSFDPGPGNDRIFGDGGKEDFAYYIFGPSIRANLRKGYVKVAPEQGQPPERDRLHGVEILNGSPKRDVIRGGPRDDFLIGDAGSDVLKGRGGDDALLGGFPAHGKIQRDGSRNTLAGGGGDDACIGGRKHACEARFLPRSLRSELHHLFEALRLGPKLRKGKCRCSFAIRK